ncbi:MAG TPA: phage holin family protein [Nevskiaceae bacterium]
MEERAGSNDTAGRRPDLLRAARAAVPLVPDHLALLAELAALEWHDEKRRLRRMALGAMVLTFSATALVLLGTALLLVFAWDTPQRWWAIGLILAFYAAVVCIAGYCLLREARRGGGFAAVAAELRKDLDVLRRAT